MRSGKGIKKLKRLLRTFVFVTYPLLLLIIAFLIYAMFFDPMAPQNQRRMILDSRIIGTEIIEALDKYQGDTGRYPVSLSELVPKYLDKVKPAPFGDVGWQYRKEDSNGFSLKAGYKLLGDSDYLYPYMLYSSTDQQWMVDG